jgi:hypothetical protein
MTRDDILRLVDECIIDTVCMVAAGFGQNNEEIERISTSFKSNILPHIVVRETLRAAIEQALMPGEPIGYVHLNTRGEVSSVVVHSCDDYYDTPLYTAPQTQQWVGLTETDLANCDTDEYETARRWERLLREKNGGGV